MEQVSFSFQPVLTWIKGFEFFMITLLVLDKILKLRVNLTNMRETRARMNEAISKNIHLCKLQKTLLSFYCRIEVNSKNTVCYT